MVHTLTYELLRLLGEEGYPVVIGIRAVVEAPRYLDLLGGPAILQRNNNGFTVQRIGGGPVIRVGPRPKKNAPD
jgi:hypothetical protein